jgi:hypothetical protein
MSVTSFGELVPRQLLANLLPMLIEFREQGSNIVGDRLCLVLRLPSRGDDNWLHISNTHSLRDVCVSMSQTFADAISRSFNQDRNSVTPEIHNSGVNAQERVDPARARPKILSIKKGSLRKFSV